MPPWAARPQLATRSREVAKGGAIGNLDGATATIALSTFTGNQALGNDTGDAQGGAIANEYAGVFPFTGSGVTTTVSQCTLANNTAMGGSTAATAGGSADGGDGGAIEDNPGTNLAVLNCSFTGNQANSGGGPNAAGADGGAIDNSLGVTVTIAESQFISNSAIASGVGASAFGGAVDNYQTMTISNCLFTGNSAVGGPMADGVNTYGQGLGGAIFTGEEIYNGVTCILTLSNSIVAGNEAIGGSGGSTLAASNVDGAFGGGIANINGGTLNVAGCTITGDQAIGGASASGSGAFAYGGGIANNTECTLNLTNSTVSTNLCQGGAVRSGAAECVASGGGINNAGAPSRSSPIVPLVFNESLGGAGGVGANGGLARAVASRTGFPGSSSAAPTRLP